MKEWTKKNYGNQQQLSISEIREELMKNQQDISHRMSDSLRCSSYWLVVDDTEEVPPHVPIIDYDSAILETVHLSRVLREVTIT